MQLVPAKVRQMLDHLHASFSIKELRARLSPPKRPPVDHQLRLTRRANTQTMAALWRRIQSHAAISDDQQALLQGALSDREAAACEGNIENLIGAVKVPLGAIGPLRVNGIHANGDYIVPLATTEAALVASYGRGAALINRAGGASAALLSQGVLRTPAFVCKDLLEAGLFTNWLVDNAEKLKQVAEDTTRHGKLMSLEPVIDNDVVFVMCRYTTGDASGQNMVTIATDALCRHIDEHAPVGFRHRFIEGNFSGDKKASYLGLLTGRGRKVSASIVLPRELIEKQLHTTPENMLAYGRVAQLGSLLSGQHGAQAHYANALAALYIAIGQDAACVSESAVGFTRMEPRGDDLFVSVTLPNILVGTVGGGTKLPSQSAALELMGLRGEGKANALAEVAAVLCLCGEISIIGAISADHFTRAHEKLARGKAGPEKA